MLRASAAAGLTAAVVTAGVPDPARGGGRSGRGADLGPVTVGPQDPRYQELTTRSFNGRFVGRPESVRVVGSTEQVVRVVDEAVRAGKRIAVRSGGHCFEGFVDDPAVQVVIDVSEMKGVYYDPAHRAFAVEAGVTLGQLYRTLYLGWGVTVPGGGCPEVGAGGHVAGGGIGALSRQHGLVVDHLYAVEVVVVDAAGRARAVVATRDPADPGHDLWWAHTGGGGGNFGVVTRYWLRSPQTRGSAPTGLLPVPPATLRKGSISWQWSDLTEAAFGRLVRNFGSIGVSGALPTALYSGMYLFHRAAGEIRVEAQVDGGLAGAERLLGDHLAAIAAGVDAPHVTDQYSTPWLKSVLSAYMGPGGFRFKTKAGFLRRPWSDRQISTVHRYLTGPDEFGGAAVYLTTGGGKVNTVPAGATAMPHRDALMTAYYEANWADPEQDDAQLTWVRELYRDVYADTGGVPVPGDANAGSFVNYPDVDLADPRWNTSGVAWHTLYYGSNYPRLREVKARWDPRHVFRHELGVEPAR
ncbi:FAD-binding protein [Micromonospora sp. NPDC049559]|uniref:FAD-binding oxidoreductase n=1 Tax=Micromonospora sp. NPDC049559 TaxID=3155923 RepID=UPI0034496F48